MKQKPDGSYYSTIELIRFILVSEMGLTDDRVNEFNQKFKIPSDDGLFIGIEAKGAPKILSNRNRTEVNGGNLQEVQSINTQELIAIMLFSRNQDAYRRAPEALMAINSTFAQQVQEENGFKIARMAPIENLSGLEGSAMLYRYEISLVVFGWYENSKAVDSYDSFTAQINDEKSKELIPLT